MTNIILTSDPSGSVSFQISSYTSGTVFVVGVTNASANISWGVGETYKLSFAPAQGPINTDPDVAYVRSDGNDMTGDGSPGNPFLTFQAAIDADFTAFDFGVGSFGDGQFINAGDTTIYIRGAGAAGALGSIPAICSIGNLTKTNSGGFSIRDVYGQSVSIASVFIPDFSGSRDSVFADVSCSAIVGDGTGTNNGANITIAGTCVVGSVSATCAGHTAGNIIINGPSVVISSLSNTSGGGTPGTMVLRGGCQVPTPSPAPTTVIGSTVNGVFISQFDSGWTANSDAGDKTAVIPSSATLATIATALDLVVSGAGSALQATAAKAKALETAGTGSLLPNA